jgi:putative endonuclease
MPVCESYMGLARGLNDVEHCRCYSLEKLVEPVSGLFPRSEPVAAERAGHALILPAQGVPFANDNDLSSRFLASWVGRAWKVYIIRCRTGDLYTGCTIDIGRRIEQHNRGTGSKFTSSRRPVTLVYQETCSDRSAALRRENQIKRMRRGQKIRLIQTASATKA